MSWNNGVVLEFLELYKKEQLLWDPKHPLHRNRSEVTDAWVRIQLSLGIVNCSIVDLKKKKESLMTSFRMHLSRKKKSPEGYHTTWFAYPLMESFLGGKYECDSTNQMEPEFFNTGYNPQLPGEHNTRNVNPEKSMRNSVRQYKTSPQHPGGAHPKNLEDEAAFTKNAAEKREMDEYELYGQLLAKKLRKLDEHQRDMAMHEIDNLMFRAKMRSSSQSRSYSTSPSPVPRKVKSPIFIVAPPGHAHYEDENITYEEHMPASTPE